MARLLTRWPTLVRWRDLALFCTGAVLAGSLCWVRDGGLGDRSPRHPPDGWWSVSAASFEPGLRICWGTVQVDPYAEGLFICGDRLRVPLSLAALRGRVRIRTPEAALRYVRLVTPSAAEPEGYRRTAGGAELVPASLNRGPASSREIEGGVMADRLFKKAGLTVARASRTRSGFVVVRWVQELTAGTRRVVEFVGEDGRYERRYMADIPRVRVPLGVKGTR